MDKSKYSSIAPTASVRSAESLEHPVSIASQAEVHGATRIGAYSFLNYRVIIYANVSVGRYCSFARGCEVGVAQHPTTLLSTHGFQYSPALFKADPDYQFERRTRWSPHPPTVIGHDVWIGAQSIVLSGLTVGHGAIIAANSVVNRNVEPYSIVGGSPARHIKYRFSEEIISRLLAAEWWNRPLSVLSGLQFDDIEACLQILEAK